MQGIVKSKMSPHYRKQKQSCLDLIMILLNRDKNSNIINICFSKDLNR